MSFEKQEKTGSNRHKARECALQMLFSIDMVGEDCRLLAGNYWRNLGEEAVDERTREFADDLVCGTIDNLAAIDDRIRTRAEHWRIERMAIVDRNVLRLAVYEFLYRDTPNTVAINEALELARRFSNFEATQFINGILDAIRHDIEGGDGTQKADAASAEQ
jgi:transcription antitermination protein NusB